MIISGTGGGRGGYVPARRIMRTASPAPKWTERTCNDMYNPGIYGGYPPPGPQPSPAPGPNSPGQGYPPMNGQQNQGNNYPQPGPVQPQQTPPNPQVQVYIRPVSSYDEALVSPADVTGALTIMPHLAGRMIYTKQLDANCNVDFAAYKRVPLQTAPATAQPPAYDPRPDIDALRGELDALRSDLDQVRRAPSRRGAAKEETT